jgi:hypothetical protein
MKTTFVAKVRQLRLTQACAALHVVPALPVGLPHRPVAPQNVGLLVGSMQVLPHLIVPDWHDTAHAPEVHTLPAAQVVPAVPGAGLTLSQSPEAPQKVRLVAGSMQVPPQLICVPAHVTAQVELTQILPLVAQFVPSVPGAALRLSQSPEAPQNVRLLVGSTHAPPHATCPPGQPQVPPLHTAPVPTLTLQLTPPAQAAPAPQWAASVAGSLQTPLHSTWVPGHTAAHAELTQKRPVDAQSLPAVPGAGLTLSQSPEAPQKVRLFVGSTHAPPQATWPPAQAQVPAIHRAPMPTATLQSTPPVHPAPAPQ